MFYARFILIFLYVIHFHTDYFSEVMGIEVEVMGSKTEVMGSETEVMGTGVEVIGTKAEVMGTKADVMRIDSRLPSRSPMK